MAYTPLAFFNNSTIQFELVFPSSSDVNTPTWYGYWAMVTDSSSNYYLMYFNYSGGFNCNNLATITMPADSKPLWFDEDIDFSSGNTFYYSLTPLGSVSSNYKRFSTDFRRPTVTNVSSLSSICNSVNTFSSVGYNTYIVNSYTPVDSGSSDSNNYNDLISAILMIPATIICLACMSVIYKMFMSRKLRGE